jgi:hypothetical protein
MNGMLVGGDADYAEADGGAGRSMFAAASALGGFILLLAALRLVARQFHPTARFRAGARRRGKPRGLFA